MATQYFKRNLLNVYREGKNMASFLLLLKREKTLTLAGYFLRLETPGLPACYPLTSLAHLPDPGIKPVATARQVDSSTLNQKENLKSPISCPYCAPFCVFTLSPSPGTWFVTPYANRGWYPHLPYCLHPRPEVLTQVLDCPFHGLFFFFLCMVPPFWTLFFFFPPLF